MAGNGELPPDDAAHDHETEAAEGEDDGPKKSCFVRRGIISARGHKLVQHSEGAAGVAVDLAMSGIDSALSAPGTVRRVTESLARQVVGAEAVAPAEAVPERSAAE